MVLLIQNILLLLLMFFLMTVANQKLSSPSVAFVLPFAVSSIYLSFNTSRWSVKLSDTTALVILGGCLSFLFGVLLSNFVRQLLRKKRMSKNKTLYYASHTSDICVDRKLLFFFLLVQCASILIVFNAITRVSRYYGYSGTVSQLIYGYRFMGTYTTENLSLGSIGDLCYNFTTAAGFVWIYILFFKWVNKYKIPFELVLDTLLSIIMCLLKGGRERAVQIVAAGLLYYLFFNWIKRKDKKELSPKQFAIVVVMSVAVMGSFQMLGTLLGRTVQADPMQYIAVYLSGSIRNLDVYLRNPWGNSDVFGKMTFIRIINYIGGKFQKSSWIYPLDLPYQSANGHNSGNIYTTFYAYLYDFGYAGVAIMPFLAGFLTNSFYMLAVKAVKNNESKIHLSLLVYSYWYYTLLFSFFSNKFYEMTAAIAFIRNVIIWIVLAYILRKFRVGHTSGG